MAYCGRLCHFFHFLTSSFLPPCEVGGRYHSAAHFLVQGWSGERLSHLPEVNGRASLALNHKAPWPPESCGAMQQRLPPPCPLRAALMAFPSLRDSPQAHHLRSGDRASHFSITGGRGQGSKEPHSSYTCLLRAGSGLKGVLNMTLQFLELFRINKRYMVKYSMKYGWL